MRWSLFRSEVLYACDSKLSYCERGSASPVARVISDQNRAMHTVQRQLVSVQTLLSSHLPSPCRCLDKLLARNNQDMDSDGVLGATQTNQLHELF